MSPVAINGVDKQGVDVNGVQVKQSLSDANSTVNKGVYEATLLETVDVDLAVGNIKTGITIFGKVGTLPAGGTETIVLLSNATLAGGASYTPVVSGIFFGDIYGNYSLPEYYSTVNAAWYQPIIPTTPFKGFTAIGDGTNFRLTNGNVGVAKEYMLFRHYISTGVYQRQSDTDIAAGATYTPASTGFYAKGIEDNTVLLEIQYGVLGWTNCITAYDSGHPVTIFISDGTNLRARNTDVSARVCVFMRAVMTT